MSVRRLAETYVATWGRWIVVLALAAGVWALVGTASAQSLASGAPAGNQPAAPVAWDWHDVELTLTLDLNNLLAWDWHDIELTPTITPTNNLAWDWHDIELTPTLNLSDQLA
ncbi:MAG TPA: hypothetical protein VGE07_14525, partial [Herpetosiphonaceae bacterium]